MRRIALFLLIPLLAVVFALVARPFSPGARLRDRAAAYSLALSTGHTEEAVSMMTPATANGFSLTFLAALEGSAVPSDFRYDGSDSRGLRMTGSLGDAGSRVIWFTEEDGYLVAYDTALDNILGSAVILCRENAVTSFPEGCCPVSGRPYEYDLERGVVVCPEGHLGEGIVINSDACSQRRDSVTIELSKYLEAGYSYPETLEEMFTLSDGEYGRRGGYQCPDNGYKYYELRNGVIYCPFHEESSEPVVEQ